MNKTTNKLVSCKSGAIKGSVKKIKTLCDYIKGKRVDNALNVLNFSKKRLAKDISKVLQSGVANAEHNYGMDIDDLEVKRVVIGKMFTLKRIMTKGRGRAGKMFRRYSRVELFLGLPENPKK